IKTEAGKMTDAAAALSIVFRAMCLRGIFDQPQIMPLRNLEERFHIRGLAVEMNRNDRSRAGRACCFHLIRVDVVCSRINIYEDGPRAHKRDRFGSGDECMSCCDHLVARSDADTKQRQLHRGSSGTDTDRRPGADCGSKLLLEVGYLFAE